MKNLIVYFTKTGGNYVSGKIIDLKIGNTEVIAKKLQNKLGADLCKIEMLTPYSDDYHTSTIQAKNDLENNARPKITYPDIEFDNYQNIFFGYPIYWDDIPSPLYTFIENHDFKDKNIFAFNTHEGSGIGISIQTIRKMTHKEVLAYLPIPGSMVNDYDKELDEFVLKCKGIINK